MPYPFTNGDVLTHSDMNAVGLHLITPSSVTGGTLSGATVNIGSGVSSVAVNGVFSSTFDNYKILVNGTLNTVPTAIGLRFGGVTSGYEWSNIQIAYGGTVTGYGSNSDSEIEQLGICTSTEELAMSLEVFAPYLSTNTQVVGSGLDPRPSQGALRYTAGFYSSNTSFTSFTLLPTSGGTMTGGTLRVYGYSNG